MIVATSAQRLNIRPLCCSHSRVNTSAVAVRRQAANAFPVSQSSPCDHHAPSDRTQTDRSHGAGQARAGENAPAYSPCTPSINSRRMSMCPKCLADS